MFYHEQMSHKRVPLSMSTSGQPSSQSAQRGQKSTQTPAAKPSPAGRSAAPSSGIVTPVLPSDIQQHLGNLLRASYNDVLTAPIPDRFLQLLEQLEDREKPAPENTKEKDTREDAA